MRYTVENELDHTGHRNLCQERPVHHETEIDDPSEVSILFFFLFSCLIETPTLVPSR